MYPTVVGNFLSVATLLLFAAPPLGSPARATDVVVTGKVTNAANGALLTHAVVIRVGAGLAVSADSGGSYVIVVPARLRGDSATLRVRALGYREQNHRIALANDTVRADFVLATAPMNLGEVVVTGAGGTVTLRKGAAAANLYSGAGAMRPPSRHNGVPAIPRDLSGEEYARIVENPFRSPAVAPLSTFGVDVDRASYSNVRRIIAVDRQRPPMNAVRIEEFVNYFPYEYAPPTGRHPFGVHSEVSFAPWAREHLLVRIGLQARKVDLASAPANNLVFLIDVSGSMWNEDKLPLLKTAFRMLVEQLREQDRVAIVVYAGQAGLVLPSTSGANKQAILAAIDGLEAGGSTAGGAGIRLAYDIAKANYLPSGNNRVILATDGDFNVGTSSNTELERPPAATPNDPTCGRVK